MRKQILLLLVVMVIFVFLPVGSHGQDKVKRSASATSVRVRGILVEYQVDPVDLEQLDPLYFPKTFELLPQEFEYTRFGLKLENGTDVLLSFSAMTPELRAKLESRKDDVVEFYGNWVSSNSFASESDPMLIERSNKAVRNLVREVSAFHKKAVANPRLKMYEKPEFLSSVREVKVAYLLVKFTNETATFPMTDGDIQARFAINREQYLEQSYGRHILKGATSNFADIYGPVQVSMTAGSQCTIDSILAVKAEALNNAEASLGFNRNNYDNIRIVWNNASLQPCGFAGFAVGGTPQSTQRTEQYQSAPFSTATDGHEYGHTLGGVHGDRYDCFLGFSQNAELTIPTGCTIADMRDSLTIMGSGGLRHFTAVEKFKQGWLDIRYVFVINPTSTPVTRYLFPHEFQRRHLNPYLEAQLIITPLIGSPQRYYYFSRSMAWGYDLPFRLLPLGYGVQVRIGPDAGATPSNINIVRTKNTGVEHNDLFFVENEVLADPSNGVEATVGAISMDRGATLRFRRIQ